MNRIFVFTIAMLFSISAISQSAVGDKDKKKTSDPKKEQTKIASPEKTAKKQDTEGNSNKSSAVPNTHQMAVPSGQQVEVQKITEPK